MQTLHVRYLCTHYMYIIRSRYLDQGVSTEVVENCPLYVSDMTDMGMAGVRSAARSVL